MRSLLASTAVLAAILTSGCDRKDPPKAEKDNPPAPPASASATAASVTTAAPMAKATSTFTLEKFAPGGVTLSALYAVEGALMVTEGQRVGRVVDDAVEWVGKIPKGSASLGDNIISSVVGYWPDGIGVLFVSGNGRAPEPTYWPLTGKGLKHEVVGGGLARIYGVVHAGASTVLVSSDNTFPPSFSTVRGSAAPRTFTLASAAGCKPEEIQGALDVKTAVAVEPQAIGAAPDGTVVSIGRLCQRTAGPAAEVWDKAGKSKIIDLTPFWKRVDYFSALARGAGDEVFAYTDLWNPVLRYHEGKFEALPLLERPIQQIFTSTEGRLYASDGRGIHAFDGGKWAEVGRFAPGIAPGKLVVDDKGAFWAGTPSVGRLKASPAEAKPGEDACPSWLVYAYPVNEKSEPKFTFPATRKALSSFPQAGDLTLVDMGEVAWHRHLGVLVKSRAQGEAVIAHLKATMKDEDPRLFCYQPSEKARRLDLDGKPR